jgi:hypothetical protein
MQSAAALVLGLAILPLSVWVAFRLNRRLHDIPMLFRIFIWLIVFVTASWPLAFLARVIVYGHL